MSAHTLFDQTEPTVLAELERVVKDRIELAAANKSYYQFQYRVSLEWFLTEINRLKPAEIDKLKQAFAEGGAIPQSAESWVKKFSQGGC